MVNTIGNIVHDSVPVSNNEDNNSVIRTWGNKSSIKVPFFYLKRKIKFFRYFFKINNIN